MLQLSDAVADGLGATQFDDLVIQSQCPLACGLPGQTQREVVGVIVAGHSSSVATAEQINKTETYRDPDSFADIVRGMHLYGRKILRPEAITTCIYHLA